MDLRVRARDSISWHIKLASTSAHIPLENLYFLFNVLLFVFGDSFSVLIFGKEEYFVYQFSSFNLKILTELGMTLWETVEQY